MAAGKPRTVGAAPSHQGVTTLRRSDEERDQARSRLRISLLFLPIAAVALGVAGEPLLTGFGAIVPVLGAHGVLSVVLIRLADRPRGPWWLRLQLGLLVDLVVCVHALIHGGPWAAIVWLVFLWQIVGMGLRYGRHVMALATANCLVAASVLHGFVGFWQDHPVLTLSLQGGLVVVPAFYGGLIARASRLQRSLVDAAEDSRSLAEARSRFLANMSHELRTPMNGVLGITELLEGRLEDPEDLRLVALQRRSGQALLRVIDDVLDLTRLEAGRLALESRDLELGALVRDAGELLGPWARDKGVDLRVEVPEVPVYVRGDDTRLRQILANLGGNAVKFTEAGHVRIALDAHPPRAGTASGLGTGPGPGTLHVRLTVEDTGIGIPRDAQGRIFEDFEQVDASITRRFGGTGLGLAIVRHLVEAMGGTLALESEPGAGCRVMVDLGLPAGAAPPQEVVPERSFGWRALVAEDNPVNQIVARRILEGMGVQVTVVPDGRAVLERFDAVAPAVVFLDLQMPVLDGAGAARALRERGAEVPIVALTADVSARDRPETRALFDAFLTKPFRTADLAECLDGLAAGSRVEVAAGAAGTSVPGPGAASAESGGPVAGPPPAG